MRAIKESKRLKSDRGRSKEKETVESIILKVKEKGDEALKEFTLKFDGVKIESFKVPDQEIIDAENKASKDFIIAVKKAKERIENFHRIQKGKFKDWTKEEDGILVGEIFKPLQKVGIYVPGGRAPLSSTLLMAGVPAQIAGVERIVIATPPKKDGVDIHILATANILGIKEIYKIGGAQAIAALAYGTETIPKVDKIVGPGNIYVTLAKKLLYGEVGIDILAGPSEVTIIADDTAEAEFVAYDLLSQTEHGPHSPAILISPSSEICREVTEKIKVLLSTCDENTIKSWHNNGGIYLVQDLEEAFQEANKLAPEHLILAIKNPSKGLDKIKSAGTVFLGNYAPVTLGDYMAGPNHILPTSQTGKWDSPLGVKDFLKSINVISANKSSLEKFEPFLKSLTDAEKLKNHFQAVKIRSKN